MNQRRKNKIRGMSASEEPRKWRGVDDGDSRPGLDSFHPDVQPVTSLSEYMATFRSGNSLSFCPHLPPFVGSAIVNSLKSQPVSGSIRGSLVISTTNLPKVDLPHKTPGLARTF